ncbi:MAG: hypothetical protein Q9183_002123 [Haloplaca sp. 2 TL-2023]
MEVAASAAAFLQAAETCIRVAHTFIKKIQAYRHADDRITELIIRIEGIWIKTETQVMALKTLGDRSSERLRRFHEQCLRRLSVKIFAATAEVEAYTDGKMEDVSLTNLSLNLGPINKIRYSLFESHLRKTTESLQAWHAVFDPSWFLLILRNDTAIDTILGHFMGSSDHQDLGVILDIRKNIQQSQRELGGTSSILRHQHFITSIHDEIPYSSLAVSTLRDTGSQVILDTTNYPEEIDRARIFKYVRDLANILSCSDPKTLGLLKCIGLLKKFNATHDLWQFQFIFALPPGTGTQPTSLRALILQGQVSLDVKVVIAKAITRAILAVHSANFVHKNVRPDTILVFNEPTPQSTAAFLVGFERSRPEGANTTLIGDMVWERNLYRHPSRQGIRPEEMYVMQHDVYSLGVCLLEIGIWQSLIVPGAPARPGQLLHIDEQLRMKNQLRAAKEIKGVLVAMAQSLLPALMGISYTDIVLSCLTCLDSDATNLFASEKDLYDEDGILVGVAFIEKILTKIEAISI